MAQSLKTDTSRAVDHILEHYRSENPGVRANLYRLLTNGRLAGTGKLVILPVDQGFEHGPARSFAVNPAGYDPAYHAQLAVDAGCNAYAAPYGSISQVAHEYAGKIPLILKMNNHDVLCDENDPRRAVLKNTPGRRGSLTRLQFGQPAVGEQAIQIGPTPGFSER